MSASWCTATVQLKIPPRFERPELFLSLFIRIEYAQSCLARRLLSRLQVVMRPTADARRAWTTASIFRGTKCLRKMGALLFAGDADRTTARQTDFLYGSKTGVTWRSAGP